MKGEFKMCRVSEKGRSFGFHLFGGDLDFPERYTLSIPNKIINYFDTLETDEEDIENILWKLGDTAIAAKDKFAIYNRSSNDFLLFNINLNDAYDGFYISLSSCFKKNSLGRLNKKYPVITIN
ncbi:MAG: hypothetical protein CI948_2684 [Halanaerobium sp.]|nr:MAG: hypothetical protein CI948_2684 [Halanaerobium sp.]